MTEPNDVGRVMAEPTEADPRRVKTVHRHSAVALGTGGWICGCGRLVVPLPGIRRTAEETGQ